MSALQVKFRSSVFVGVRDDDVAPFDWFGAAPVSRFGEIAAYLADDVFTTSVRGIVGARDPVYLVLQGRGLASKRVPQLLKQVETLPVGVVLEAANGYREIVGGPGSELVLMSLQLLGDASPVEAPGVVQVSNIVENGRSNWRCEVVFTPVDSVWIAGTGVVLTSDREAFAEPEL